MFRVEPIDLSHQDGFHTMIMQSAEYRDQLIPAFKRYVDMGYNPNDVIDKVFSELSINENDLIDSDVAAINRTIEDYYKRRNK